MVYSNWKHAGVIKENCAVVEFKGQLKLLAS
jgi:hypothetical protein